MCVRMHVCMYVCMYVSKYVCMYVCIHTYIHTYILSQSCMHAFWSVNSSLPLALTSPNLTGFKESQALTVVAVLSRATPGNSASRYQSHMTHYLTRLTVCNTTMKNK